MTATDEMPTALVPAAPNAQRPLPDGWRWVRLGEVATYINGRAFKPDEWSSNGLPIVRIQNLNAQSATYNYFAGEVDARNKIDSGDLLISWSASLDAYMWDGGPAALNQHIFKVMEQCDVISRRYLYFAARMVMSQIRAQVHGATMQHVTKPEFEATWIPLPPLPEQRRIAAILTDQMAAVERARAAAQAQLEAARMLPAAYLRAVFDSAEAQWWPMRPLNEVCQLLPSKSIASDGDTEVRAITTGCLSESGFLPSGIKTARMWARDAAQCKVMAGEILVARSNTPDLVGRAAMFSGIPQDAVASDLTIRIWPGNAIDPGFLAGYLSSLYLSGYWKERAGGASGSMKKITRTQIQNLGVPVPSLSEQREIAMSVAHEMQEATRINQLLKDQLDAIGRLPGALLRRAFSGEL